MAGTCARGRDHIMTEEATAIQGPGPFFFITIHSMVTSWGPVRTTLIPFEGSAQMTIPLPLSLPS
jgi:hypothetical protein